MTLDDPIRLAIMFPKAETAMRKLTAFEAPLPPNTFSKNKVAVVNLEFLICAFVDAAKNAMFTKIYKTATATKARGALNFRVFVGFSANVSHFRLIFSGEETHLDFIHNVEGVLVTRVRKDNLVHGVGCSISGSPTSSLEGVLKVCSWVLDTRMSTDDY